MKIILNHWLQSFSLFSPLKFKAFLAISFKRFFVALTTVLSRFGVLLLTDLILIILFGNVIFKLFSSTASATGNNISLLTVIITLLIEINWFILSTAMLLFIRKKNIDEPLSYFKQTFFAYLQLLFVFYLILFAFMSIFLAFGITQVPHIPWFLIASHAVVKLLTIFYWLDSSARLKETFISFEQAVNCFAYNIPVIVFLVAVLWGFDLGLKSLFFGFKNALTFDSMILTNKIEQIIKINPVQLTILKFLGLRYILFLLKNLWTSFAFVFYDQKKGIKYSRSCLEVIQQQSPPL